ncbi:MAG: type II toxin-antitoxin system PemK/MazF family toxin [Rubrivivax sp.]|nr:type II toxin-antitoxin system PemK/MazF family toxin [Rubrivivax sp.]
MKTIAKTGRLTTVPRLPPVPSLAIQPPVLTSRRGEIWAVDFEPQSHFEEPGKIGRPVLVLQADSLNGAQHPSTIVSPSTSQTQRSRMPAAARAAAADAESPRMPMRC